MKRLSRCPSPLRTALLTAAIGASVVTAAEAGSWCGTPVTPCDPFDPTSNCYIPPPPDPRCEPRECDKCTRSPCFTGTGVYTRSATDLALPAVGYTLVASRRYESSHFIDGPTGYGWTSSLAARLYYTTYLFAAPSTYQKEADITMPDGARYRFVDTGSGFTPPLGRHDTLVHNADGSFDLTLQRSTAVLHFGSDGSLLTATDEFGNVQSWSYDGSGRIHQIADSSGSGRSMTVLWGADGRMSGIQDSAGRQISYVYDSRGVLIDFWDAAGRYTAYSYVPGRYAPLLNAVVDNWGRIVTQITYDSVDRAQSYTEDGETYTYSYAYQGNMALTGKSDSLGNAWTYGYGAAGLVTSLTPPAVADAHAAHYSFYPDGSVQAYTDEVGVSTVYTYDAQGRVLTVTQNSGQSGAVSWQMSYDPNFPNRVSAVVPLNPATGAYFPDWQAKQMDYYPVGSPAPGALYHVYTVRADGVTRDLVRTFAYDSHGRVTQDIHADGGEADYSYDAQGNLASETFPANNDAGTRPVLQFGHDAAGRVISETDAAGNQTLYTYDALDRMTSLTLPDPAAGYPVHFVTQMSYDNFDSSTGLLFTVTTDVNGHQTKQGSDPYGHVLRQIDELGNVSYAAYSHGHLVSIVDSNGNATNFSFDALRRLVAVNYPDGGRETYAYQPDGKVRQYTDRRNNVYSFQWDAFKRLQFLNYPNNSALGFIYAGQKLIQASNTNLPVAENHIYTYDARFRVVSYSQGGRGTTQYSYTPGGNVASFAIAGGPTVTYTYYPDESLDTVSWSAVSGSFKFAYDLRGLPLSVVFPNGQLRNFAYDAQGRVLQVTNTHPVAGNLASFIYGYDIDNASGTYTELGQQTSVTATVPAQGLAGAQTLYSYDAAYQLTKAVYPGVPLFNGEVDAWTYDAMGNRTSSAVNGVTSSYSYFKNGSNPNNGWKLASDGVNAYGYDANGNTSSRSGGGTTTTFGWDLGNRLQSATSGSLTASYQYDHWDRRSTKTVGGAQTAYLYNRQHVAEETSPSSTAYYLHGPGVDNLLGMVRDGTPYYYSTDDLGSVALLSDTTGAVAASYAYDAWGVVRAQSGTVPNAFGFTGRETGELGTQYSRQRWLLPGVGRFASEDPKGLEPDLNPYRYVGNSPLLATDPTGLDAWPTNPTFPPDTPWPDQPGCSYSPWASLGYSFDLVGVFTVWQRSPRPALGQGIGWLSSESGGSAFPGCACFYKYLYSYKKYRVLEHLQREKSCPVCNVSSERRTVFRGFRYERVYTIRPRPSADPENGLMIGGLLGTDGDCICPDRWDNGASAGL